MRILFLTHRLPYAPNRGDRVRAYHLLRVLSQRATIDLVSLVHDVAGVADDLSRERVSRLVREELRRLVLLSDD